MKRFHSWLPRTLQLSLVLFTFACTTGDKMVKEETGSFVNRDPIILLHGLNGFDRDSFESFYYWGGTTDLELSMRLAGYDTRTASVGPLSSNWDRSCELYAYLKGGRVDYGEFHSEKNGHKRYGRTYPGIFPQWGEVDPQTGEPFKIHILSHSMGGTTARTFAQLMNQGSPQEREAHQDNLSPLFEGGQNTIKSITTISTPHDGSTLSYNFIGYKQRETILQIGIDLLTKVKVDSSLRGDLHLEHWDWMGRGDEESLEDYESRIEETMFQWQWTNKDFADYDLSPEGAWENNGWVKAQEDIYYFSWTTRITKEDSKGDVSFHHSISPGLIPFTVYLYTYQAYRSSLIDIDSEWKHNDGAVNCISQSGPKLNSTDKIIPYEGTPQKGVWNFMGDLYPMDHATIIGLNPLNIAPKGYDELYQWYRDQAELMVNLP